MGLLLALDVARTFSDRTEEADRRGVRLAVEFATERSGRRDVGGARDRTR
jgi:hypothetical protein